MADVKHVNLVPLFKNSVDNAINMRLTAIQEMPKLRVFWCRWTAVGQLFQGENSFSKLLVPLQRRFGVSGVDIFEKEVKVALGSRRDSNDVCHA